MSHKHIWLIANFSGLYEPPLLTFVCSCGALKEIASYKIKSDRSKYKEDKFGDKVLRRGKKGG